MTLVRLLGGVRELNSTQPNMDGKEFYGVSAEAAYILYSKVTENEVEIQKEAFDALNLLFEKNSEGIYFFRIGRYN
jgi:hypothetical protein